MNRKIIAILLCLLMASGMSACQSRTESSAEREDGGGTGYDAAKKSILIEEDLYFLRPGTARSEVEKQLGTAQEYMIDQVSTYTYTLSGGEKIELTYGVKDTVDLATYTDSEGNSQDLFIYLSSLGVLTGYMGNSSIVQKPDSESSEEDLQQQIADASYFAVHTYRYDLAEEILKEGVTRDTVVAALGKPNSYSSVDFKKDGYIVDVYVMEDGSSLYLDYGYARTALRAVRQVKGGSISSFLGTWGAEAMPTEFYRSTVNVDGVKLRRNAKPSEIYAMSRLGEPDWLEGTKTNYKDAYQLSGGRILYLEFGPNHSALSNAYILSAEGKRVPMALS